MREPLLEVRDVAKRFGALTAVDQVSFAVHPGEIVGVIGPNGAGKTSLFHLIAGSYTCDGGQVWFAGRDVTGLAPHRRCRLGLTRTFQIERPFPGMTVLENVTVGAFLREPRRREATEVARRAIELVGLGGREEAGVDGLTLMERKRVELARALATRPRLLMVDEFMGGLNPEEVLAASELMLQLCRQEGVALCIIEHVMDAIMSISDRIVVLNYGAKIAEGAPAEVAANDEVVAAYLGRSLGRAGG